MMTLFALISVFVAFSGNSSVISTLSHSLRISLTTITLQDQFEANHTLNLAGKWAVIMVGDREGLKEMPRWEEAIKSELGTGQHHIVRLAYFKGMPFFVPKGWARDAVKKTYPKAAVLCDWDGVVGDKLNYKEGFTAYLLDESGQIRARLGGEFAQERIKSFVQAAR